MGFELGRKCWEQPREWNTTCERKTGSQVSLQLILIGNSIRDISTYELEFSVRSSCWMSKNDPKKDYVPILVMCIIYVLKLLCCPQATEIVTCCGCSWRKSRRELLNRRDRN